VVEHLVDRYKVTEILQKWDNKGIRNIVLGIMKLRDPRPPLGTTRALSFDSVAMTPANLAETAAYNSPLDQSPEQDHAYDPDSGEPRAGSGPSGGTPARVGPRRRVNIAVEGRTPRPADEYAFAVDERVTIPPAMGGERVVVTITEQHPDPDNPRGAIYFVREGDDGVAFPAPYDPAVPNSMVRFDEDAERAAVAAAGIAAAASEEEDEDEFFQDAGDDEVQEDSPV